MRRISIQRYPLLTLVGVCVITANLLSQGCASSEALSATNAANQTQSIKPVRSVRSLAARISERIQAPRFSSAAWGIKIVSLETGRTLFERDANKYFLPASNVKLYTGALALETFPADYRFATDLYATAPLIIRDGILTSDLVLYGRGDPTLGAAQNLDALAQPFDQLAARLAKLGIKRVRGKLIVDDSYFATPSLGSGWQADDLQWSYGAPVSALTVHENMLQLSIKPAARIGLPCEIVSVTPLASGATDSFSIINRTSTTKSGEATSIGVYRNLQTNTLYVFGNLATDGAPIRTSLAQPLPAAQAGNELRAALARYQIMLEGQVEVLDWLDRANLTSSAPLPSSSQWHHIAGVVSPPLAQILQQALKRSQNLYAQSLLLQVGRQAAQTHEASACIKNGIPCTTEQWGIYALKAFLPRAGLPLNSVFLEEGSGLSRGNLATPAATVALLQYMNRHPSARIFHAALPIAGVDGTLKSRMRGTAAANNARAKTGSMRATYTLSGYVSTALKEPLAFSIMLNNYVPPSVYDPAGTDLPSANQEIDAIVIMLAEFIGHS